MDIDEIDLKVLRQLMSQGRMTWAELAGILGLSAPAASDRARRLEERGIITGYSARLNPELLGLHLTAFIAVTLAKPQHRNPFLERIQALSEVQECHHVTGDDDYLLKVRCRHTRELERLISDQLKSLPGIQRTRTTIVLSTEKETADLPVN